MSSFHIKSQKPKSSFEWFCNTFLHIETFFIIICIAVIIYFLCYGKPFKFVDKDITVPLTKKRKKRKLNQHETKCREIFEDLFGVEFNSVRPDWLKNPITNKNLELDGFNETIKTPLGKGLAFEYDGAQHSKYSPYFHGGNKYKFYYQLKKDSWKDNQCKKKGIMLIRIPYFVPFEDLEKYIKEQLTLKKVDYY